MGNEELFSPIRMRVSTSETFKQTKLQKVLENQQLTKNAITLLTRTEIWAICGEKNTTSDRICNNEPLLKYEACFPLFERNQCLQPNLHIINKQNQLLFNIIYSYLPNRPNKIRQEYSGYKSIEAEIV